MVARRKGDTHVAHDTHVAPPKNIRIWHRNYYEMIVRSFEAEARIAGYIRMNPWRCVQNFAGNLAAAEARNRFVIDRADALFTPHVAPGGMLERLLNELLKTDQS